MNYKEKEKYDINDLIEIVQILRSPDGCPWDKVQTHESIRREFIEEVYEVIDAIDAKDTAHLREELGDVLFQVIFHTVIEMEQQHFDLDDVTDEVCRKMIIRHPHVFGDIDVNSTDEVLKNWDAIKMQTHSQKKPSEALDSVSRTLPSLMRAEKLHKKAARGGVSYSSSDEIYAEIDEKLARLRSIPCEDKDQTHKVTGGLLFALVGLSAFNGVDFERSLYDACEDYIERFRQNEMAAGAQGVEIQDSGSKA